METTYAFRHADGTTRTLPAWARQLPYDVSRLTIPELDVVGSSVGPADAIVGLVNYRSDLGFM